MNKRPKILIVDDKSENLMALEVVLKDLDIDLVRATSGNDALKETLHHDFALALLDIQMPEMDGYELASILRDEEKTAQLPFIFISAVYTDNLNVFKGYEKGAFSFITKPFQPEILINKVKFFIEKYQQEISLFNLNRDLENKNRELKTINQELKAFSNDLKDKEEQIRTIFSYAPDAIIVIDEEGKVVSWNPMAEKVFGWKQQEVAGSHLHKIIIPERFRKAHVTGLKNYLKTREGPVLNKTVELAGLRKDKSEFHAEISISPFLLKGDHFFVGFIKDVTDRKIAEEQLQATNKELEAFTYSVSHDLRAPLRAVSGYAQILDEDFGSLLSMEAKRLIRSIKSNASKMGVLIDDLLTFSRLGRKSVQKKQVDMSTLVKDVLNEMKKTTSYKAKISIGKLHEIRGDYNLLYQVMINLLSNAIKYSSKKENPLIQITSYQEGDEIVFAVKDNGAGFNMQYADKLFGVFQRLHGDEEFEGTGVGLAIVHRIISKHSGRLWAEGKENEGATFYFTIEK